MLRLALAVHDELLGCEGVEAHRPVGVQLRGGNADLGAEAELAVARRSRDRSPQEGPVPRQPLRCGGLCPDDARRRGGSEDIGRTELYETNALIGPKIFSIYIKPVARAEVDDLVTGHPNIQKMWPVLGTMDW